MPITKTAETVIYVVDLGGGLAGANKVKYAWRAKKGTYPNDIMKGLGVRVAKDTEDGLIFGCNTPKPLRVRVNFSNGKSRKLFADPAKAEDLMVKGTLNGKKIDGFNINSVTIA